MSSVDKRFSVMIMFEVRQLADDEAQRSTEGDGTLFHRATLEYGDLPYAAMNEMENRLLAVVEEFSAWGDQIAQGGYPEFGK